MLVVDLAGQVLLLHEEERAEAAAHRLWCVLGLAKKPIFSNSFSTFCRPFFRPFVDYVWRQDCAGPHHAVVEPVAAERERTFQTHPGKRLFVCLNLIFFQIFDFLKRNV